MGRGSSKISGSGGGNAGGGALQSMSGKPFDANDFTTWTVGTKVEYLEEGDVFPGPNGQVVQGTSSKVVSGTVKEVYPDHLIVDVPSISDHMYLDETFADLYRAKKK